MTWYITTSCYKSCLGSATLVVQIPSEGSGGRKNATIIPNVVLYWLAMWAALGITLSLMFSTFSRGWVWMFCHDELNWTSAHALHSLALQRWVMQTWEIVDHSDDSQIFQRCTQQYARHYNSKFCFLHVIMGHASFGYPQDKILGWQPGCQDRNG